MAIRDVKSFVKLSVLKAKAQTTANVAVAGANISQADGACFVVDIGASTTAGLEVTFQHRDGSDAWADIPANQLDGSNDIAIATTAANSQVYVGYTGNKEQIGALITDTAAGDAVVGLYVVEGYPKQFPRN